MKRDLNLYFDDILESIEVIKDRINGISEKDFREDGEKHDSVTYRFAIICEAVNKIPAEYLEKYPQIEWPAIIAMRNILIHEYFEVDLAIIWDTIQNNLEELGEIIREIQSEYESFSRSQ